MNFDLPEDDGEQAQFAMGEEFEGAQMIDGEFFYASRRQAAVQTKDQQIYGIWAEEEERSFFSSGGGGHKGGRMHAGADSVLGGGAVQFVSSGVVEPSKSEPADAPPQPFVRVPRKPVQKVMEREFGKFEKHTKGFGMKMLQKMGFTGRLGKHEDGIVNPIDVKQRKPGQALQGVTRTGEDVVEQEVVKPAVVEERFESRESNWKKGKKKEKTVYKSASELLSKEIALTTAPTPESYKIVDMTGREVRILTQGADGQQIRTVREEESWTPTANSHQLPELQHNLKLLVEMTEEDIMKIKREITATENSFVTLKHTREKAEARLAKDSDAIERAEEALSLVDQCLARDEQARQSKASVQTRLESIADGLDVILHRYPNEWQRFGLANLAEPQAFPLMKAYLHAWEPLRDAKSQDPQVRDWAARMARWRSILSKDPEVFRRMLDQTLVPIVHMCISSQWQPREHTSCIRLMIHLQDFLPDDLFDQIRQQSVIPKLKRTVDEWDPRTDAVPVHSWILPWRDLSPETELQPLYEVIQAKLAAVLREWHPKDGSAFAVISPWQDVFLKQNFEALLARSILPKLHNVLRAEFVVNPRQQNVDPFTSVMTWAHLIPSRVMIQLLRMEFFPKWFAALYAWAGSRNPNFEEMSQWYLGWRNLIPDVLRETPDVKQILNRALDMMRMSLEDPRGLPGLYALIENELKNPPTAAVVKPAAVEKPTRKEAPPMDMNMSFKEILQRCADHEGLEFVPNQRRGFMDGKQIFNFGKVAIYLDNRTIYASVQDATGSWGWTPISLQDLLDKAR